MNANKILKNILLLQAELKTITSMRSGSLTQQYNVCGSPGCKCKDPIKPKKHGPYFKLRTKINEKGTTKFVKDQDVVQVTEQLANYKKFNRLILKWISLANDLADLEIISKNEQLTKLKKMGRR